MDANTGKIYEFKSPDKVERIKERERVEVKLGRKLVSIPADQLAEVRDMNRRERRDWAAKRLRKNESRR